MTIIDFEERAGLIRNAAIARRLAIEFVGPVSNQIGDECVMDPTYYPDPPLAEYLASAGYENDDGSKPMDIPDDHCR
jgi:hypothetical protein